MDGVLFFIGVNPVSNIVGGTGEVTYSLVSMEATHEALIYSSEDLPLWGIYFGQKKEVKTGGKGREDWHALSIFRNYFNM